MKKSLRKLLKNIIDSSYFSVGLVLLTILFLFVLFRMKVIEQQYNINASNRSLKTVLDKNKMLKAKKANEISIKKLKNFAVESDLKEPTQKQLIIIEDEK